MQKDGILFSHIVLKPMKFTFSSVRARHQKYKDQMATLTTSLKVD